MSRQNTWTNDDGLVVGYGPRTSSNENAGQVAHLGGNREVLHVNLDYDNLPAAPSTAPSMKSVPIPAGAVIVRADLNVETAFTSGGATTLTIGLVNSAGTAIDADGIDATIAKAALTANTNIVCDGALIGANIGTADGYISTTTASGPWTAGDAVLTIEYIRKSPDSTPTDPISGAI